jgi:hypothetical protein
MRPTGSARAHVAEPSLIWARLPQAIERPAGSSQLTRATGTEPPHAKDPIGSAYHQHAPSAGFFIPLKPFSRNRIRQLQPRTRTAGALVRRGEATADVHLTDVHVLLDQSMLTGESLPIEAGASRSLCSTT